MTLVSSNPGVAAVDQPNVVIPAGERMLPLRLASGAAGTARIRITAPDLVREFEVVVGSAPPPANAPVIAANPVGVSIVPLPGVARLGVTPGAPVSKTLGVVVVSSASAADRTARVTTSNASVVSVGGGGSSVTLTLPANATVLPLGIATSGATGAAVITIEIDGVKRELLIVVGDVPPSQQPAITAPVIGVTVG